MKKILLGLILIFILGCTDKTDKNGFYTEGENIGLHKKTKTFFNKEGYNKDGFNINGWSKDGINIETRLKYDSNGYDIYGYDVNGFNAMGYDSNGFDKDGWSKDGINIETKTFFNKNGISMTGVTITDIHDILKSKLSLENSMLKIYDGKQIKPYNGGDLAFSFPAIGKGPVFGGNGYSITVEVTKYGKIVYLYKDKLF